MLIATIGGAFFEPLLFGFAAVAFTCALVSLFVKSVIAKFTEPAPPPGRTAIWSVAEPFVYPVLALGTLALVDLGWGWSVDELSYLGIGLLVAFVLSAGLHGRFLAHRNPDISETRLCSLSILYALPLPALYVGMSLVFVATAAL